MTFFNKPRSAETHLIDADFGDQDIFELAFVGSGASSSVTLINWIERLLKQPLLANGSNGSLTQRPIRIALIEKRDFFGGLAYGNRAGKKSLIITNLEEFLPQDCDDLQQCFLNLLTLE